MNYQGKHCIVVGLGESGFSAAKWLAAQGARVTVADSRSTPPNLELLHAAHPDIELRLGAFSDTTFADAGALIVSPGVPLATPAIAAAVARGVPALGDVELFAQAIAGTAVKVIAITGSNGKSTVTSMVGQMCEAAGLKAVMAGNIGLPVLDALTARPDADVFVLELSSFQLETTTSLNADAATVLNISEDHLDRYKNLAHYAATKAAIFAGTGTVVLNREDAHCLAMASELKSRQIVWFGADAPRAADEYGLKGSEFTLSLGDEALLNATELPVAGLHNAVNALSAIALCRAIGLETAPLLAALKSFTGLAHRVEYVATVQGVDYFDDSKGTNVGATEAALKGMTRPVVLIAGGDGKGQDFRPLKAACARICRAVILIGRDAPILAEALNEAQSQFVDSDNEHLLPVLQLPNMEMAVQFASNFAESGDVVLLSPACASLDMYRNYHHRAEVFIAAVKGLAS
ncbi:UDP-N-acetylmuramoyl-L-alanine--D-glutamate ligase [Iodobacter fluviatilis]|uniref:UDP-N-acetylmuramoylalanine--D-glutamate ligase n=1 Tax=Iodobacter fluviatilis TaxID=537 RepID=A0A377SXX1_9NEIS|nr:UDP-N-acetylmuramoyl-L-alanine--D-glutamate ligase [Iodobacter fluviatilis]TCU82984.1 UDP-N-acetylmuramoylalanine--D-glutamate ligase [Iodobacter fluviatilis]STR45807.1 UDP-N-acetylmuramoylalanine--D-glutamate ligase [Iodobacter fluviatilis]